MKKVLLTATLTVLCGSVITAGASAASPEPAGQVTVFSTEFTPLTTWDSPDGCEKLPAAAHVIVNQTSNAIRVYSDPLCLTPGLTVAPGYGSHVPAGAGSFSLAS